jgi:hypothetical protein
VGGDGELERAGGGKAQDDVGIKRFHGKIVPQGGVEVRLPVCRRTVFALNPLVAGNSL